MIARGTKRYVTSNLKLAAALGAAGFEAHSLERAQQGQHVHVYVEIDSDHNGLKAQELAQDFEDRNSEHLQEAVNRIIADKGLTPKEQSLLAFDAGRTAGLNRVAFLKAAPEEPLVAKSIGAGRMLLARASADKDELRRMAQ